MRELTTEAKVGLLAVVVIAALFLVSRRIADTPSGGGNRGVGLWATFDSAAGLAERTSVKIAGVPVGEVEKIERAGNQARILMRIHPSVQLPLDSTAVVRGVGLLGDKEIVIIPGGAEEGPTLRTGEDIRTGEPEADLDQIIKRVDAIAQDVQAITGSVRETIGTAEGQEKLQEMVDDLAEFSDNLATISTDNREALNEIVENLRQMSERLNQVIDNSGEDLDETFVEIKKAAIRLDSSLASIDSVAGKIDRGEGTIGRLINDEQTVDSLNEAIGGITEIIDSVNRIHIFVNYQGEFQVARADRQSGVFKNQLSLRIQPREDYGYIVGISDDPGGLVSEKTTTYYETVGGVTTERTVEERKVEDAYLFTAQFAKRWGNAGGRIGLKESTGGVGADYWAFEDRLKFSFDAYQFSREQKRKDAAGVVIQEEENPRLKAQVRYDFHKHMFVVGGADDIISNYDRRAFYLGAGFEFRDDDLKWVAGSIPLP